MDGAIRSQYNQRTRKCGMKDDMIWGFMIQLGHNMWKEAPLYGEPTPETCDNYAQPYNRTDVKVWNEVTEYVAKKGANLLLIDLGEGLAYPSHPELAVKGSWSPERMKEEIARLKKLGLEAIPKLNFSACHDAWLKDYSHMVSTPEYYKVCADVIHDVCEIFCKPRFFHLGWDEERSRAQKSRRYLVERKGDLWWHDFLFTVREVEKQGVRPWIWSDKIWLAPEEFKKRMPKSVMQSPWHYDRFLHFVRNTGEMLKLDWPEPWAGGLAFKEIDEAGYDAIPCGSTWSKPWNMEAAVRFSKKHLDHSRIKGFLMAPWTRTYRPQDVTRNRDAADRLAEAKAAWSDDREDLVVYGSVAKCIDAAIAAREKEGREPVIVTPDAKPAALAPEMDFKIRDALLDIRWGATLAKGGVVNDGDATVAHTESGKTIRCVTFRDLRACPASANAVTMQVIAHRGIWDREVPQNTVESIRRAYEAGATWVETDFHHTKAGQMVCVHAEKELASYTGCSKRIVDLMPEDIETLNLGKRDGLKKSYRIPLLDQVLAVVPSNGVLQAEIKGYSPQYADIFDKAVKLAGLTEKNIVVSSFQYDALKDFRARYPKYRTVWLVELPEKDKFDVGRYIAKCKKAGFDVFCPGCNSAQCAMTQADVETVKAAGLEVRMWGVNSQADMACAKALGATGFTSNYWHKAFDWANAIGGIDLRK